MLSDRKLNATNEQDKETHGHRQQFSDYQRAGREIDKGKGSQLYGDRGKFNFRFWAHNADGVLFNCILKTCIILLVNITLINLI